MKKAFSTIWILTALALGSLLLAGCGALGLGGSAAPTATPAPVQKQGGVVTAEGHIVPRDWANLFFSNSGRVAEVLVKEGDKVKKGDVLLRLGDREAADAAVTAAELELTNAQRQSDDLKKKSVLASNQAEVDLANAERNLIKAQQTLADVDTKANTTKLDNAREAANKAWDEKKTAQEDFDKVKDLDKDSTTRKTAEDKLTEAQRKVDQTARDRDVLINNLSLAKAQVDLAKAQVDDARATRDARKSGPDPADQAQADARLKNAKAQLAAAQAARSRLDLTAPYDATVVKLDTAAGEQVQPNQVVLVVADLSKWYVDTSDLAEKDVVAVRAGLKATIVADALPEESFAATVESVANLSGEKAGDVVYTVRLAPENPPAALRWGMTVKVTFTQK